MRLTPRTLKRQLTLLFLGLTLVPAILVTAVVSSRLLDALDRWEQPGVQRALTGSYEVARDLVTRTENDLRQRGQLLAADPLLDPGRDPDVDALRERLATAYNLDFLQIYDPDGTLRFEVTRDPLIAAPGPLEGTGLRPDQSDPFLRDAERGILAHVGFLGEPGSAENLLVVGIFLDREFYGRLQDLSQGVAFYAQLRTLIRVNQRAVLLSLGVGLAGLALVAVWVARWLAGRISRPVEALGAGMESVARGTGPVRVEPQGGEEMEHLILTFNAMSLELDRSRRALAQAERQAAWRDVARRVAHEIRNALTPITFSIHRVRRNESALPEGDRETLRQSLDTVLEEVEGLKRLASSFSELARLPVPDLRSVDLNALVSAVVTAAEGQVRALEWTPEDREVRVEADPSLLRQAVNNVLRNAAEAASEAGRIWVRVVADRGEARIVVEDDGPGWDEVDRGRAMEPYVTTKEHGTGLGLSLVQRTLLQHGGSVELGDRPGGGARVTLVLPGLATPAILEGESRGES